MATSTFSYHVLKNIISHLDIQKRLQIAVLCPELKTAERAADFHLNGLSLRGDFIVVNRHAFVVLERQESYLKKALDLFFANRECVEIKKFLSLGDCLKMIEKLPKDLKLNCRSLYLDENNAEILGTIRPFLTNLPLEQMEVHITKPEDPILQDELVQSARHLIINNRSKLSITQDLLKLRNQYIEVEFEKEEVMTLVESWLQRCPEFGTKFCWKTDKENNVEEVMDLLKSQVGAKEDEKGSNVCHLTMKSGHELSFVGESKEYLKMEVVYKC